MIKVELGQRVIMITGGRGALPQHGEVVKIGRVWIEVRPDGWGPNNTNRFRLDTQTDGSTYGSTPRFHTLDQWAERERQGEAARYLRDQGISIDTNSPWRGREVELAGLLRDAQQ